MKTTEEKPRRAGGGKGGSANPEQGKERKLAADTLLMLLQVAPWRVGEETLSLPPPAPGQEERRGRKEHGLRLLGSPRVGFWMWLEDRLCIQERFSERAHEVQPDKGYWGRWSAETL